MKDEILDNMIKYALSFLGTPYKWGGNSHLEGGFDCSGFVLEVLRSAGLNLYDQTAHHLYSYFINLGLEDAKEIQKGQILFFGKKERLSHVGIALNPHQMIEAGGGGKSTHDREDAARDHAFVRIRFIDERRDFVTAINLPLNHFG